MKKKIAIVDAIGANFSSVIVSLKEVDAFLTHDANLILSADAVILPGVGAAGFAMEKLSQLKLIDIIKQIKQPVLGICLGMQLLFSASAEDNTHCLDIISGKVMEFDKNKLTVPHMGWNNLSIKISNPIVDNLTNCDDFYFVHSFYAPVNQYTIATCNYGHEFSAIVQYNNFYGTQFHPEKSGKVGMKILQNFIKLI